MSLGKLSPRTRLAMAFFVASLVLLSGWTGRSHAQSSQQTTIGVDDPAASKTGPTAGDPDMPGAPLPEGSGGGSTGFGNDPGRTPTGTHYNVGSGAAVQQPPAHGPARWGLWARLELAFRIWIRSGLFFR